MDTIHQVFWKICLLKKGPQDVPAHSLFLLILFGIFLGTSSTLGAFYGKLILFTQIEVVYTGITVILILALLALRDHTARFNQTLTAIFGVGIIFNLIQMLLFFVMGLDVINPLVFEQIEILLLVWYLAVTAHILRHALAIHFGAAIPISIFFFFISIAVHVMFAPVAT